MKKIILAMGVVFGLWSGAALAAAVNINTATAIELEQVHGIGAATAAAIVAYRTEHGDFKSVDDLTGVKGIGEKKLETIKEGLSVE